MISGPLPPDGRYYSEKGPFLTVMTAICAGTRSERARFTVGTGYYDFCEKGYGLTREQTKVLVSAAYNVEEGFDFSCVPTPEQLSEIIDQLAVELAKPESARAREDLRELPATLSPPPLDPILGAMFPTLIALYSHFILGEGPVPESWQASLSREFEPELPWLW